MKVDLSRFRAAPSARLSHLPFESDGTFIHCCSTSRRSCGTHSDRIQASTQWYLQSDAFSLANRKLSCAVSIGVDPVYGRPCVARRPEPHARAQCTDGDVKGLVVSPCGLGQDHLVKCQIRHCPPQTRVLSLKQLQSLQLITVHAAILFTPAIICLNCDANGFRTRSELPWPALFPKCVGLQGSNLHWL